MHYDEAYKTRLDILREGRAAASNPWMRDIYQRAMDLLDLARSTYLDLEAAGSREQAAYERCAENLRTHSKAATDRLVREADQLAARYQKGIPPEEAARAKIQADSVLVRSGGEAANLDTQALLDDGRLRHLNAVKKLDATFRDDILIGDTRQRTKAAVRGVAKFGAGFLPGAGPLLEGADLLRALDDFERAKDRVANERIQELERFNKTLSDFCTDAQTMIKRLDDATEIWEECEGYRSARP